MPDMKTSRTKRGEPKKKKVAREPSDHRILYPKHSGSDDDSDSLPKRKDIKEYVIKREPKDGIYYPIIVKITPSSPNIFDSSKQLIQTSSNIDYPKFCYGFQHFLHADKGYMDKTDKFEGKKKVFLVMNPFEETVSEYDDSILASATATFPKKSFISRDTLKFWELFCEFSLLIDLKQDSFTSLHIQDGPGSSVQATYNFRNVHSKKSKNDKHYALTVGANPPIDNEVPVTKGKPPQKVDLVICNGGYDYLDQETKEDNIREQSMYQLLIDELVLAIKFQKKGSNFICRFYETFTKTSLKIVTILTQLYDTVYFAKPLISRPFNTEKYAVCLGYKLDEKHTKAILETLEAISAKISKSEKKLVDIFGEYEFSSAFVNSMIEVNTLLSNEQLKCINKIAKFIDDEIYSGDVYQDNRLEQIRATQYWNKTFLKTFDEGKLESITSNVVADETNNIQTFNQEIERVVTPA